MIDWIGLRNRLSQYSVGRRGYPVLRSDPEWYAGPPLEAVLVGISRECEPMRLRYTLLYYHWKEEARKVSCISGDSDINLHIVN